MSATAIHGIIEESWPEAKMNLRQTQKLFKEFKEGERTSFGREEGSGRKKSDERVDSVERVKALIDEDNSRSIQWIAGELDIPHTMVQRILKDDIHAKWVHTKWVPHTLSIANKALRVERCKDLSEALPTRLCKENLVTIDEKFFYLRNLNPRNTIGCWMTPEGDGPVLKTTRRSNMDPKLLVIIAVSQKGEHMYEIMNPHQTLDSQKYINFLSNLEIFLSHTNNPILFQNMRLIQDNARPHVSRATLDFLQGKNVRLLKQPPYSPDCNMCDRYIFPRLEAKRHGNFASRQDLANFLDEQLPLFTRGRMNKALQHLEEDLMKIIEKEGDYLV